MYMTYHWKSLQILLIFFKFHLDYIFDEESLNPIFDLIILNFNGIIVVTLII